MTDIADVRFADPWALALLSLVVAGAATMALRARRPAAGVLFSSLGLLPAAPRPWRVRLRWVVVPLRVLALVMLVVALARPQVVHANAENVSEGIDIVLVIDTSGSMSERGFGGGTKIDGVKRVVHDFLGALRNDRVGIVAAESQDVASETEGFADLEGVAVGAGSGDGLLAEAAGLFCAVLHERR